MCDLTRLTPDARAALITSIAQWKAEIKSREGLAKAATDTLIADLFAAGDTEAETDQFIAKIQNTTRKVLSPERLIAAGVDPDLIAAATVESTSSPFIRLYPKKGD